jgi:hypothetical protein
VPGVLKLRFWVSSTNLLTTTCKRRWGGRGRGKIMLYKLYIGYVDVKRAQKQAVTDLVGMKG